MVKLLLCLLFTLNAFGMDLPPMGCPEKVRSFLKEWKVLNQWQEEKQGGLKNSFFASPTSEIGEWVLARRTPKGTVISRARDSGRIEVFLDEKKCLPVTKSYPHGKRKGFTDSELSKFITTHGTGVIYVWSPRMDLSVKGIQEIQKAAREKKLPLLVLMDKDTPEAERMKLEKTLGKEATRTVDSFELDMRHVQMHFPAVLMFKDKKILSGVKYGFEKAHRYKLDLDNFPRTGKRL